MAPCSGYPQPSEGLLGKAHVEFEGGTEPTYLLVGPGVERGEGGAENGSQKTFIPWAGTPGSPEDSPQPRGVSELRSRPPSSPAAYPLPPPRPREMPRARLLSQRFAGGKRSALKLNWIKMSYLNTRRKTWTQTKKSPREGMGKRFHEHT